jgi:phosphomannomutase
MTLIKSISGIRGTIGGAPGDSLTPTDIVKFALGYGQWLKNRTGTGTVVIGRDARMSGEMVENLVVGALMGLGHDVINLGLSTTPTVEMVVPQKNAAGGIILTASHNPKQWNALKLLNEKGEFLDGEDGAEVLRLAETGAFEFAEVDHLGKVTHYDDAINDHIEAILKIDSVKPEVIKRAQFKVVVDAVHSTGGIAIPKVLEALGVDDVICLYCEPTGDFPHNPEPLPEHLTAISSAVKEHGAHLGIVVDPDVDRLCFVNEDGTMFGEEYTLVAVADYLLKFHGGGNTVSNLSSTRALRDVTEKQGGSYTASAVGEVNVVKAMKDTKALIGGEGNGGVIFPELHYGRDALVGVGLFLTHLAEFNGSMTELKAYYPSYVITKNKIQLTPELDVDALLLGIEKKYANEQLNKVDGLKIDYKEGWVHLRKSNTEPIIRIYAEAESEERAMELTRQIQQDVDELLGSSSS